MATNTYVELDRTTVTGSPASSITLNMGSTIAQSYTDLVLVVDGAWSGSGFEAITLQFNGDTGSNYSRTLLWGNGSTGGSSRESTSNWGALATTQSNSIFHIMNYSSTTSYKTVISRGNSSGQEVRLVTGVWRSNSAITSILVKMASANFSVGTTFSLYGIAAEPAVIPTVTGGTLYSSDPTYNYRVFTASSDLVVTGGTLKAEVLLVAGGGGGGRGERSGGGGGAGGMFELVSHYLPAGTHSITIGSGGAKAAGDNVSGTNGTNSSIGSYVAIGGGAGAGYPGANTGGSGGGGSPWSTSASGASGTSGQGNSGGDGNNASNGYNGGGGGGKGANGGSGTSPTGGAGSTSTYSGSAITGVGQLSGGSYYFAGGGAGATQLNGSVPSVFAGGVGGGGNGSSASFSVAGTAATNGTANTGGGGGGGGGSSGMSMAAGNGGSGIVVIRYAKA